MQNQKQELLTKIDDNNKQIQEIIQKQNELDKNKDENKAKIDEIPEKEKILHTAKTVSLGLALIFNLLMRSPVLVDPLASILYSIAFVSFSVFFMGEIALSHKKKKMEKANQTIDNELDSLYSKILQLEKENIYAHNKYNELENAEKNQVKIETQKTVTSKKEKDFKKYIEQKYIKTNDKQEDEKQEEKSNLDQNL